MAQQKCHMCQKSLHNFNHLCKWHETGKKTTITQRLTEEYLTHNKWNRNRKQNS